MEIGSSSDSDMPEVQDREPLDTSQPLWQFFFILLWQSIYHVSSSAANTLLIFVKSFISFLGNAFSDERLHHIAQEVPLSTNAAYKFLQIS